MHRGVEVLKTCSNNKSLIQLVLYKIISTTLLPTLLFIWAIFKDHGFLINLISIIKDYKYTTLFLYKYYKDESGLLRIHCTNS